MSELRKPVLYCDTDRVILIQNVDEPPPPKRIRGYLDHLTDELEEFGFGIFIEEFAMRFLFLPLDRKKHNQKQG